MKFITTNKDRPFFFIFRIPPYTCRYIPAQISRASRPTAHTGTGLRRWTGASARCWTLSRTQTHRADAGVVHQRQRPVAYARQERRNGQTVARRQRDHVGRGHARADDRVVAGSHRRRHGVRCDHQRNRRAADARQARWRPSTRRPQDRRQRHLAVARRPEKQSPHDALFYFHGNQLQAVRSGPWKLAITPQGTGMPKGPPGR